MTHRNIESHMPRNHLIKEGAILGALSVGLALVADAHAGARGRQGRSDRADMVDFVSQEGSHDNYVISGYHTNGRVVATNMNRHLQQLGSVHFGVHPERGLSIDSYKEVIIDRRKKEGHKPARLYAMSMGALLTAKMFSDESFRKEFGEVVTLAMDSGLSGKKDVNWSSKAAMALGTILPVTYATDKLYHLVSGKDADRVLDYDESMVTFEEAKSHLQSSANTSFDAAKSQILFMNANDVDRMDLAEFGKSIQGPIVYLSSSFDDVLNPHRAARHYSDALHRDIEFWTDTRRAYGTHATGPERPQSVLDAMLYQNQDKYRISTVKAHLAHSASNLWTPDAQAA